VIEVEGKASGL